MVQKLDQWRAPAAKRNERCAVPNELNAASYMLVLDRRRAGRPALLRPEGAGDEAAVGPDGFVLFTEPPEADAQAAVGGELYAAPDGRGGTEPHFVIDAVLVVLEVPGIGARVVGGLCAHPPDQGLDGRVLH